MTRLLLVVPCVLVLVMPACAQPLAPSPPIGLHVTDRASCVLVAGQSNADLLYPHLTFPQTVSAAMPNQPIRYWDVGNSGWSRIEQAMSACAVSTVVWWQGESDARDNTVMGYEWALWNLAMRINGVYPIRQFVVVGLLDPPAWDAEIGTRYDMIRQQQRDFVARWSGAMYLDTRGVPLDSSTWHATEGGYSDVAARLAILIR